MKARTFLKVAATSILVPWLVIIVVSGLMNVTFAQAGPAGPATPPTTAHFAVVGDYGWVGQPAADVSALIHSWNPDFVITTGDNNYDSGAASTIDPNIGQYYHDFIFPYTGIYGAGAPYNKFFPSLGNHDWNTPGAIPYLNFFGLPGNERYYDFTAGPVHLYSVDSDGSEPDGITSNGVQGQWLQTQLATATEPWKLAYFHHPPYSSGAAHGNTPALQWPFQQWGATAVLSGHEHNYERLIINGFPYLVDGLGGRSLYGFGTPLAGSIVRYDGDYGAMLVDATAISITFQFINRSNIVIDTYTINAPLTPTPTATRTPTFTRTPTPTATFTSTSTYTNTPTATNTPTNTPTPVLVGHVMWQGRPAQPNALQQMPVTLTLKLGAVEVNYPTQNTDANGAFTVSVSGLAAGTYDWRVKGPQYLANAGSVALSGGSVTNAEMGLMDTGDCDNTNVVNINDSNILRSTFGKSSGDPGYDARAEFTGDSLVSITDFTLLKGNFGQGGAPPVRP